MAIETSAGAHRGSRPSLSTQIVRFVFKRYMRWRLDELSDEPDCRKIIALDYRFDPRPRWGYDKPPHDRLTAIFERGRPAYRQWLAHMLEHREQFFHLDQSPPTENEPSFQNGWFLGLDAVALYTILAVARPKLYVEVGSGNSTLFARRAIRDNGLPTRIVSIDPHPRAEVDALCDRSIRSSLEETDQEIFAELGAGDILFIDNSHRSFQNSDVTVFFLEILPRLKPGVIVHVHDIFLPLDYPAAWSQRHYNEQYLLACWLLANPGRLELMLSNAFVSTDRDLCDQIAPLWDDPRFANARAWAQRVMSYFKGDAFKGISFWAKIGAG